MVAWLALLGMVSVGSGAPSGEEEALIALAGGREAEAVRLLERSARSAEGLLAVPAGMATVRGLGSLIAHIVPRDETSAVSEQSLVGRVGVIVGGSARRGLAAQARVRDSHGRSHYLMVEPDIDTDIFGEGTQVLIVRKAGAFYRCISNPHPTLM